MSCYSFSHLYATFDYLRQHETIGLQTLVILCSSAGVR